MSIVEKMGMDENARIKAKFSLIYLNPEFESGLLVIHYIGKEIKSVEVESDNGWLQLKPEIPNTRFVSYHPEGHRVVTLDLELMIAQFPSGSSSFNLSLLSREEY